MSRPLTLAALLAISIAASLRSASAQSLIEAIDQSAMPNVPTKTLGGMQFWSDELVFRDWRIQHNFYSGHHRLLDPEDTRRAWGSFEHCRAYLDRIKRTEGLKPMKGKVVIVLHGLGGSRSLSSSIVDYLAKDPQFTVISVSYCSTRDSIDENARLLGKVIANLPDADEIELVSHSLGALVIRRYWNLETDAKTGHTPDKRIKRIVMLGPPNQTVQTAQVLGDRKIAKAVLGESPHLMGAGAEDFANKLTTPTCEFGIVAGGRGDGVGYNPLLDGDNDFVVRVPETRLAGARDSVVIPSLHFMMLNNSQAQEATLHFLQSGNFNSEHQRHPIEN